MTQFFTEYKNKRINAVFGYYSNLKIFIKRLKKLTTDIQKQPLNNIYLLSANAEIKKEGKGYEQSAEILSEFSSSFLNYLCLKSEQIPVANCKKEADKWDNLIEILTTYLSDFELYSVGVSIPSLNSYESIKEYHKLLLETLCAIESLIKSGSEECWKEIENSE